MNTLKKFLNWFTNNDLREDVEQLEDIIYSGEFEWERTGLLEKVSDHCDILDELRLRVSILEDKFANVPQKKDKAKVITKRGRPSKKTK